MTGSAHLTRAQARAVDRIASEVHAMPTLLLMENAARSAAVVADEMLGNTRGDVLILIGPGNNGGDGFGVARFLANAGHAVTLALVDPVTPHTGDARIQRGICEAMSIPVIPAIPELLTAGEGLIIDAMFGTGLTRALDGLPAELARATGNARAPVLALDIPSGLDADTGEPLGQACVRASTTVTFVSPKVGFRNPASLDWTGRVVVGDIGVPRAAIDAALRG